MLREEKCNLTLWYSKQRYAELKCSTDNTKVKPYLVAIIKLNGRQDLIKVRNRYLLIS